MEITQTYNCEHCKYFHQHYVKGPRGTFIKTDAGHCVHPRLKDRKPDTPSCQRFSKCQSAPAK